MNQPNCLFCGKPADHKCGDAYDCGACCSMRGLLAHDSPLVYKWLENMIRPELLHLRSAPAQEALSDPHVLGECIFTNAPHPCPRCVEFQAATAVGSAPAQPMAVSQAPNREEK